jgi:7-keto-8-aminopelargonate synthetase-like enzyme
MAGSARLIDWFLSRSETRSACSQPCSPVIHAAEHALWVNEADGDQLRSMLAENVRHLQTRLREIGIEVDGGLFPVQAIPPIPGINAQQLHAKLNESGIQTVLIDRHETDDLGVGCLITAKHVPTDLDIAADAIAKAIADADAVHV